MLRTEAVRVYTPLRRVPWNNSTFRDSYDRECAARNMGTRRKQLTAWTLYNSGRSNHTLAMRSGCATSAAPAPSRVGFESVTPGEGGGGITPPEGHRLASRGETRTPPCACCSATFVNPESLHAWWIWLSYIYVGLHVWTWRWISTASRRSWLSVADSNS